MEVCYDVYVCDGVGYVMEEGFGGVHVFYFYFLFFTFFKSLVLFSGVSEQCSGQPPPLQEGARPLQITPSAQSC